MRAGSPFSRVARRSTVAALSLACSGVVGSAQAQSSFNTSAGVYSAHVTSLRDMPFRTVVRQQYDYSCGSAALATLLRFHYGRPVDEAQVFNAMYALGDQPQIRKVGFSLLDMKAYLTSIGLTADGYHETLARLQESQAPAIAVITVGAYRHFVVVKGVRAGKIMVGDPALGLKLYTLTEFQKVWSGIVFLIHPAGPQAGSFNQAAEWAMFVAAPRDALSDASLASFTRGLPPIYQITPVRVAGQ